MPEGMMTTYNPYAMERFQRHFMLLDPMTDYHDDLRTMPARDGSVPTLFVKNNKRSLSD